MYFNLKKYPVWRDSNSLHLYFISLHFRSILLQTLLHEVPTSSLCKTVNVEPHSDLFVFYLPIQHLDTYKHRLLHCSSSHYRWNREYCKCDSEFYCCTQKPSHAFFFFKVSFVSTMLVHKKRGCHHDTPLLALIRGGTVTNGWKIHTTAVSCHQCRHTESKTKHKQIPPRVFCTNWSFHFLYSAGLEDKILYLKILNSISSI